MNTAQAVLEVLRAWHRQPAGALAQRLDISRPSLMRAIAQLDGQVVSRGRARRTAYAARRTIRGNDDPLPLYRIDEDGRAHEAGLLEPIYPQGCAVAFNEACPWPLDGEMTDGWFDGLPYMLGDMRPQGFLGRNLAHRVASILQVDEDVKRWSEDDVLHVLSVLGSDQPGNYILGEQALRRFLEEQQTPPLFFSEQEIAAEYPRLALQALTFGEVGSSAAGEFSKFTARRLIDSRPAHVIVKFSGADGSPQEQRWADLLVCEHLALNTIAAHLHVEAATSRIHQFAGRTFYEVERFDRHGEFGRSGVCTWHEVNGALFGLSGPWAEGAQALLASGIISAVTARQINLLQHFGRLIGNSDMHDGNLAFLPGMTLAPAYDMLPMQYSPQRGVELAERKFAPPLPLPKERGEWLLAAQAALAFWQRAGDDARISAAFRGICSANAGQVERMLLTQRD